MGIVGGEDCIRLERAARDASRRAMAAQSWGDVSSFLAHILVATAAPLAPLWTAARPLPRRRGAPDDTEKPEAGWATTMRQTMAQTAMDALHTRPRPDGGVFAIFSCDRVTFSLSLKPRPTHCIRMFITQVSEAGPNQNV